MKNVFVCPAELCEPKVFDAGSYSRIVPSEEVFIGRFSATPRWKNSKAICA